MHFVDGLHNYLLKAAHGHHPSGNEGNENSAENEIMNWRID